MAPAREWSTSSRVGTAAAWGGRSAGRATVWKSPAASGIRAGRAAALRLASRGENETNNRLLCILS